MQMDNLRLQLQQVQVENARLRDDNASLRDENASLRSEQPEAVTELSATVEAERRKLENEELQAELQELRRELHESQEREARTVEEAQGQITALERQLQEQETNRSVQLGEDVERLTARCEELESCCDRWEKEVEQERSRAELDRYRALEAERRKWEAREERLLDQLRRLEGQQRAAVTQDTDTLSATGHAGGEPEMGLDASMPAVAQNEHGETPRHAEVRVRIPRHTETPTPSPVNPVQSVGIVHTSASLESQPTALATALLAQQLPPIGKFTGETDSREGETFEAWHEQFEMVASITHWDPQTKLVNLTTRLKGQAYTFYRSCTIQQRASYDLLVAELTKRFKPVRLQSVQSSMFHERKQKLTESVDAYAQDLCRLFHLAYPKAQQGSQETENMRRSVLAYQFVAGLLPEIKLKLAGTDGSMDELLVKARLQEAKLRDLIPKVVTKKPYVPTNQSTPTREESIPLKYS